MSIGAGVVVAITLQQVDGPPYAEAGTEGDHEGLKNVYRRVKEIHTLSSFKTGGGVCPPRKMVGFVAKMRVFPVRQAG